jgi:protein-L-isoaspartate(D-aspartate) O-methyltransferase
MVKASIRRRGSASERRRTGIRILLAALLAVLLGGSVAAAPAEDLAEFQALLVAQVVEHARLTAPVTGRETIDPAILAQLETLPRHVFVEPQAASFAYLDVPLPAEHGLRESQPFIVALMTDIAAIAPGDDVLILGVGGGYHQALASALQAQVFSVDLDEAAVASVRQRLESLDYPGIELRAGDPYDGWPELDRQFDAIIVRLAVDRVPPMLYRQLAPGGRLVAPVGRADDGQTLTLVTRDATQGYAATAILPVRFMRLPGGERL